ncbi:MAG: class SAM-dependent methyltransferase [Fibrobacteria bacterium]|jgi:hypothetical protein|nr:class SAM-dependent methyltransferase [Fibrobacteria bacterium]
MESFVAFKEIRALLEDSQLRKHPNLRASFTRRLAVLDHLEVNALGRLMSLPGSPMGSALRAEILSRIEELESWDEKLFQDLREEIRMAGLRGRELKERLWEIAGTDGLVNPETAEGYDSFDILLNGIFCASDLPEETKRPEPEMVFYQKTPGRVILELVDRAGFTADDVFYDLGSGLGQVPILVHLLSGVPAKGVEFEPAYVQYSERSAGDLGITGVTFLNADAREADLSDGTVFFLYTPFTGRMLEEILENLRKLSERKPVRVFTYGPCTLEVSRAPGWISDNPAPPEVFKLGAFTGR